MDLAALSNQPATTNPASQSILGDLSSLFADLQGLVGKAPLLKLATINESSELEKNVEYVASRDGLKKELTTLQQREETRMNQVRQQNELIGLRKEKIAGTGGYSRSLDDAVQVRTQKKSLPIGTPLEDESISEERLFASAHEEDTDIARIASASPDFNEAFLATNRDATTQKEEQQLLDQYEFTSEGETKVTRQHSLAFEKDEIILLDHLNEALNYTGKPLGGVSDKDVEGRILAISNQIDRKHGGEHALAREIEKRIERIGQFIDKKTDTPDRAVAGKAFVVPSTKSVQRLRSKFGKH